MEEKTPKRPIETIVEYLEKRRIKIQELEPDTLTVKYQLCSILIAAKEDDNNYAGLTLANFDDVTPENFESVRDALIYITTEMKVAKGYLLHGENTVLSYEFNYQGDDDMLYNIGRGLDALVEARRRYYDYRHNTELKG